MKLSLSRSTWKMPFVATFLLGLMTLGASAAAPVAAGLRVFFIDVEGGQATLCVAPTGQSLLIDTGWSGRGGRDADRIVKVAHAAGLDHLDGVLITHFHEDHVGGVPQLVDRIPVGKFFDHGVNRETDNPQVVKLFEAYREVLARGPSKRVEMKVGERLPLPGFEATVLSADGKVLEKPLPGGGQPNEFCKASETRPADQTENARSLGIELVFGKLKILDLGDLTWDKEMAMMCPLNRVGTVDVLVVSHHGWNQSSSPALVDAVHARVAVMDNGEQKGGSLPTLITLEKAPGLEAMYQLHASQEGGAEHNRADAYLANPMGTDDAHWIELTGTQDGSFTVKNERTGATQRYAAR